MSIPTPSSRRARHLRAAIGERSAPRSTSAIDQLAGSGALPSRRRRCRPARAAQRLPRSPGGGPTPRRDRARRAAIRERRQHDRPHGRARRRSRSCDVPERAAALDDFYRRYADDPLIIDKWLSLQAAIPEAGDARPRQGADRASGVLVRQSQPRARADRRLRDGEPDAVQPRRRRRLRLPRRYRARARSARIRRSRRGCCPRSRAGACSKPTRRARARSGAAARAGACRRCRATCADIVGRALAQD